MRHYPRNSPQAAARIVTLAMLSDGHLAKLELDLFDRLDVAARIGLDRSAMPGIVHAFCEDLLSTAHLGWADACRIDACTLAALMQDIDDPALRLTLLQICAQVVDADAHVADGESTMLMAALDHWGLPSAPLVSQPA